MARIFGGGALAAAAMGVHNLPEGLALGVAPAIGKKAAWLLFASTALHNLLEGLAVAAAALFAA
jgi:zinc transporter ZupT